MTKGSSLLLVRPPPRGFSVAVALALAVAAGAVLLFAAGWLGAVVLVFVACSAGAGCSSGRGLVFVGGGGVDDILMRVIGRWLMRLGGWSGKGLADVGDEAGLVCWAKVRDVSATMCGISGVVLQ